jgi:RNA polymerase sigma-70 factor (ECF subfamily)
MSPRHNRGVALPATALADLMLVDRCLGGEQAAARELFRAHEARVHGTLFRVLGSNRDMDDLLQEAFIQVFRSLKGFRGEARLATWIDRITARVAYRYLSQRRGAPTTVALDDEAGGTTIEASERAMAREGVRRLYAALDELGPAARLAFTLHEIDGRPVADVARCVGASVTATKLRIWRARRALERRAAGDPVLAEFLTTSEGA